MTGSERPAAAAAEAQRAGLLLTLGELDAASAGDAGRGFGARRRLAPPVERPGTPAAAFLRPELELRLARHAAAGDRNDDGDTLQADLLGLLDAWPGTGLVGLRGLSVADFGGAGYVDLVAGAASDPDPRVRAAVAALGPEHDRTAT
ncbi:hypothetical protein ACFY0G_33660 [Streptomyces sp. NPDC001552]|uniref:hypothetical protein n=1 Tax=Streptomyces sp. NPDC001552 TaxID=3364587 RepID=UPI003688D13F